MSANCSNCNTKVDRKFCNECGTKVPQFHCEAIRSGKFCDECGVVLSLTSPPAPAPIPPPPVKNFKRHCFILNNNTFPNASILGYKPGEDANLFGYKKDAVEIKKTFESLGFAVTEKENAKDYNDMRKAVKKWAKGIEESECVVLFILSHGGEHGILYACDGSEIHIDEIRKSISNIEKLDGVPKLCFVQACRGVDTPEMTLITDSDEKEGVKKSGARLTKGSKFRDTFVYYCTAEGYAGFVGNNTGSVFITKLCEVLKENGKKYKLWELVTKINKTVSETVFTFNNSNVAQCPEAVFCLSSDVDLFKKDEGLDAVDAASPLVDSIHLKERNPCFIITNVECGTHKIECRHFQEDKEKAMKTFSELNFNVREVNNKKMTELEVMFKDLKAGKIKNIEDSECVVFVVLSCGGLNDSSPIIYGSDGLFYSVDIMVKKAAGMKNLTEKPKVFFMVLKRCSRDDFRKAGKEKESGVKIREWKAHGTNTLIYYIVLEEDHHTLFISELCKVLTEFSQQGRHLGDVIHEVNRIMFDIYQAEQIPEVCCTLTKLVYFRYVGACQQSEEPIDLLPAEEVSNDNEGDEFGSEKERIKDAAFCMEDIGMVFQQEDIEGNSDDEAINYGFSDEKPYSSFSLNTEVDMYGMNEKEEREITDRPTFGLSRSHDGGQSTISSADILSQKKMNKSFDTPDYSNSACVPPAPQPEPSHTWQQTPPENHNSQSSGIFATPSSNSANLVQDQVLARAPSPAAAAATIEEDSSNTETTTSQGLSQLGYGQRKEICLMLEHGKNNWKDFGMVLVERFGKQCKVTKEEIEHLSISSMNSPAKEFLERLATEQPDIKVKKFSEMAFRFKRNDIVNRLKNVDGETLLDDIAAENKKSLIRLLDRKVKNGWKDFADKFGFKNDDIKEISKAAETDRPNAAEELLDLMDEKCGSLKLTDFHEILMAITRLDIADQVNKIIESQGGKKAEVPSNQFDDENSMR